MHWEANKFYKFYHHKIVSITLHGLKILSALFNDVQALMNKVNLQLIMKKI